jgi:protein TonB
MEKLRSREFLRYTISFLLAVGFHALFFLVKVGGLWGSGSSELEYTLVHPRLLEIETAKVEPVVNRVKPVPKEKPEAKPATPEVTSKEKPQTPVEEKKAKLEEVVQEQPSSRETAPPEPGDLVEREEEDSKEVDAESGENEESEVPVSPPLPPLGGAKGMVVSIPSRFSYPKNAEHKGIEGNVLLELYLSPEGTLLEEPRITVSSGHPELDGYCINIFKAEALKYKPASESYKIIVEVRFFNNKGKYEVEPNFIGEATYLSVEEGENLE